MNQEKIRNFAIIAHIDHGKSTLADRILEITGAVSKRELKEQMLDSMELEQERGITIKMNAVRLNYKGYTFNLIDTPGHVDFSYEVSRSLAACEGALLLVDATQGIEAQTLANYYLALENDLEIIPVINKIDLPSADPERITAELMETFGFTKDEMIFVSAKTGQGVDELLDAIIDRIPAPTGSESGKLKALIFDSRFDSYRGVVVQVRVVDGVLKEKDIIRFMSTKSTYDVVELGFYSPKINQVKELHAGEVGYLCASIKTISDIKIGDTITVDSNPADDLLKGYMPMKSMVFSGMYPVETNEYDNLRDALEKLKLNDASLSFVPETSKALGFGFRCGFLGLLHMDIIKERIEREFNVEIILTSPSVVYQVYLTNGDMVEIDNPSNLPEPGRISKIEEPYIKTSIFVPTEFIGPIMELCENKRGTFVNMEYINKTRVNIHYELPLSEIMYDFFDKLKSVTKGYASFDYDYIGYRENKLVKLDILLNGEVVDALSIIVYKDFAYNIGKNLVNKLRKIIPRQLFEVPIQASIGSKVIARETISSLRKNVLAKCYGGDISRKKKLLEKQKEGKKRMKQIGSVEVPPDAFLEILSAKEQ
ncbi:MAG: translation elongation factor 4 [Bacilli bacterium]|nr:translation elongation factor 4 [Bacilli bacterium]